MKLISNLAGVIDRLEELQAGYPAAVRRALAPEQWTPRLRDIAEKTLTAQVWSLGVTDEMDVQTRARLKRLIPQLVDTVMGVARPEGSLFQMWLPPNAVADISFTGAAKFASNQWTPMGRAKKFAMPDPQGEENLQAARQAVLDWVMLEKKRDTRDEKKDGSMMSDDQIADRVERIMGLRPKMGEMHDTGDLADPDSPAGKLRGAIQAWLDGDETTPSGKHKIESPAPTYLTKRQGSGISNAQAAQWLGAVLAAWVSFARVHLRDRVEAELNKLHARVKAEQRGLL